MIWKTLFAVGLVLSEVSGLQIVYLTDNCNASIAVGSAGLVEPDARLNYRNNLDCTTILSVASPSRMLLQFYRFFLEEPVNGICVDSLTVYDGAEESSPALTEPLCGRVDAFEIETTGSDVSFVFKTDGDGSNSGFGIFYTAFVNAPCTSLEQFECNNSRCIDSVLVCDSYDMCGDRSDESNCNDEVAPDAGLPLAAVIGIVIAALCFVGLVFAVSRMCINKHKSKRLMEQLLDEMQKNVSAGNQFTNEDFWGSEKAD